jgi:hypothetical protein
MLICDQFKVHSHISKAISEQSYKSNEIVKLSVVLVCNFVDISYEHIGVAGMISSIRSDFFKVGSAPLVTHA